MPILKSQFLTQPAEGDTVIVTEHGKPLAVLHTVDAIEDADSFEERMFSLAKKGLIRLPAAKAHLSIKRPRKIKGRAVSKLIAEDRR